MVPDPKLLDLAVQPNLELFLVLLDKNSTLMGQDPKLLDHVV